MSNGITISTATFNSLDASLRTAILEAVGLADRSASAPTPDVMPVDSELEELAVLSDRQMRKFLVNIHPKTRAVLEALADLTPRFESLDLSARLGVERDQWRSLAGVWSGLTKRTRSISNDPEASLIVWSERDPHGFHTRGELHPSTHQALRRALGK